MAMAERDASDFLDPVSRASEVIYCGKFRLLLESAEFVRSITVVVAQTLVDTELGIVFKSHRPLFRTACSYEYDSVGASRSINRGG